MYADIIMMCRFFVYERDALHLIWFATILNPCEQYRSKRQK